MEEHLIDYLYYPHVENVPCDEYVARNGIWLTEEEYESLD